jgi:hypothetical protein
VENVQQLHEAPVEVQLYVNTGQLSSRAKRPEIQAGQIQKFVGQRTFQLDQGVWNETSVMAKKDATPIRIEFDSKEYWDLVTKNPELREVLALGTEVRFELGGKVYEIFSKNK